ncbi:MAG: 30S ribosomal protein S20, partial [Candidatus Nealsonbacteria bacterium CG_4_9_14_0_8_um_filter_35_12]
QSLKRRKKNLLYKEKIKNLIKEVRNLVLGKKTEEAKKLLPRVYKILDKAAKERVIKKNTVARKKSRITKLLSRIKSES